MAAFKCSRISSIPFPQADESEEGDGEASEFLDIVVATGECGISSILPILVHKEPLSTGPTGCAKMFALETAAGESNSLFCVCRRASTTRYDVVVDALLILLLIKQMWTEREQTPSRFFCKKA